MASSNRWFFERWTATINGVNAHVRAVPFGGYKNSGVGRERGMEELYSMTEEKSSKTKIPGKLL